MGLIRDPEKNQLIDLGVVNERIGLYGRHLDDIQPNKVAS